MTQSNASGGMRTAKQILIAILVILVLIVILQNRYAVTFHFLFWEFGMSLILLIPLLLLCGFAIGLLVSSMMARKGARKSPAQS